MGELEAARRDFGKLSGRDASRVEQQRMKERLAALRARLREWREGE